MDWGNGKKAETTSENASGLAAGAPLWHASTEPAALKIEEPEWGASATMENLPHF